MSPTIPKIMKLRAILVLLIFTLTLIIYSNSLGGEFVYDDEYFVVRNIAIRNLANIPSFFINPAATAFSGLAEDVYRPIASSTYALDYFMWFYDTFGYHLENVLLHALNAILVFVLLFMILGDIFVAFFAAVFFASHPVQTEVVSWISGRSSVLFLSFYLASLVFYVKSLRKDTQGLRAWSIIFYALSLFSKEMAVTLPLVIMAYDIHFFDGEAFRRKAARYAPYILMTAFYILIRSLMLKRVSQCDWWGGNPYYNFLSAMAIIPEYMKLLLYPAKLCAFYVASIARSAAETRILISLGIMTAITAVLPYIFRRSRPASFAVFWFFITLLPVSNMIPLKALMAERFLYLPSIGFCMLAAMAIGRLRHIKVKFAGLLAVILASLITLAYSARTIARNNDWKDPVALSESIIKVSPLNPWGYTSLGSALIGKEQYARAVKPLMKAMSLSKNYPSPRNALGFCYLQLGQYDDAVAMFSEAARLDPKNIEAISSMGVAYAYLKRYDDAIRQFNEAIRIDPTFVGAYLNLGTAYEHIRQYEKALEVYRRIPLVTNSPQDVGLSYIRMGDLYLRMGQKGKAAGYYQKAIGVCGDKYLDLRMIAEDRIKRGPKIDIPAN